MHETFFTLIRDLPHWEFEIVASTIQDALIFLAIRAWSRREHRIHHADHRRKQTGKEVEWLQPQHMRLLARSVDGNPPPSND